jgi:restriction system protein
MIQDTSISLALILMAPLLLFIEPAIDIFFGGKKGKILYKKTRSRGIESLRTLSWSDFEHVCAGYFSKQGYRVEMKGLGGADGGMDLLLRRQGKMYVVQCKHWKGRVGVAVVREMYGVMHAEKLSGVFVVGLSGFTKEACRWASGKPIHLLDGQSLLSLSNR